MYLLYRSRHVVSWLPAILIAGGLLLVSRQTVLQVKPHYDTKEMTLSLAEPEPAPADPVPVSNPEPEPQSEPEPEPVAAPVVPDPEPVVRAKPVVKPKPVPKPKKVQTKTVKPAERTSRVRETAPPRPAAVRSPVNPPVAPPAPPAPKVNTQAAENGYLQALRRELEQRKRYPTGRQASLERPEGNVEVWLEVDRSGRVLASGVSQASSMLLRRAAISSLQSINQLKPFPEGAFAGQQTQKFTATFNYQAP